MQVWDALPRLLSDVRDHAVAVPELKFTGDALDCHHQVTDKRSIFFRQFCQRDDFLTRNDQHMCRRLGTDVTKGETVLVFVHDVGGNLAVEDAFENGLFCHGQLTEVKGTLASKLIAGK